MSVDDFEKKYNIKIVENHLIYFNDLDDFVTGALVEDTIYLMKNFNNISMQKEREKIEENMTLLRGWI